MLVDDETWYASSTANNLNAFIKGSLECPHSQVIWVYGFQEFLNIWRCEETYLIVCIIFASFQGFANWCCIHLYGKPIFEYSPLQSISSLLYSISSSLKFCYMLFPLLDCVWQSFLDVFFLLSNDYQIFYATHLGKLTWSIRKWRVYAY